MAISTPVLAAIIGSIVAGAISLIVNLASIGIQYWLNRKNQKQMEREQWRRETISVIKELRREALRMDLSATDSDLGIFDELVKEIEGRKDRTPPFYRNTSINSDLADIILYHREAQGDSDFSLPNYRQKMIECTEAALDTIEEFPNEGRNLY